MGSVFQDLFLSPLSLSLSLHPTVTMLFLPRLPLLLAIIFLGLFCLPQTIVMVNGIPPCEGPDFDASKCMTSGDKVDQYCVKDGRTTCFAECRDNGGGTIELQFNRCNS